MIVLFIIGAIFLIAGLYAVIKGKFPIVKTVYVIKKESLYYRINGTALFLSGSLLISFYIFNFRSYLLIIGFVVISFSALIAAVLSNSI
jgi:hypothetical protein